MMPRVELPKLKCPYCGYEWVPRTPEPKKCPNCHNVIWRLELKEGEGEKGAKPES
jgi:rubrerythrin